MTALLAALWADRAAAPESCAAVRRLMRLQVWPHRLASGFPDEGWGVAGKTGTLPGHPQRDRRRRAARRDAASPSPCSRAPTRPPPSLPQADRLIGTAARIAVDALRAG